LLREIDRLVAADRRRLVRERDEADYLLQQQQRISDPAGEEGQPLAATPVSSALDDYYQELVRTYVIMGSGNLTVEIARLAELLVAAGFAPRDAFDLHLSRVGRLVRGLGNRSTRHVMARADLLALELMIHLAECYRRRASESATAQTDPAPG
jgi:hypothetical protein